MIASLSARRVWMAAASLALVVLLAAAIALEFSTIAAGAPQLQQLPPELDWLGSPPPDSVTTSTIRTDAVFVGLVLPPDLSNAGPYSATLVAAPAPGKTAADFEGMVVEDPAGKKHPLKNGALITFAVGEAGKAALPWSLQDANGKVLGRGEISRKLDLLHGGAFPSDPLLLQSKRAVLVPGPFAGDATNTKFSAGDHPGQVIAEGPGMAVVVPPDLGSKTGKIPVQFSEAGKTYDLEARALAVKVQGATKMHTGQRANLNVTISGLEGLQNVKTSRVIKATLLNTTPQVVDLNKQLSVSRVVSTKDIAADGAYRFQVPYTALTPGAFSMTVSVRQDPFCCNVACAPCDGIWFCSSKGIVQCSHGDCGGGCGAHAGGSACGRWLCGCKFKACACGATGRECK